MRCRSCCMFGVAVDSDDGSLVGPCIVGVGFGRTCCTDVGCTGFGFAVPGCTGSGCRDFGCSFPGCAGRAGYDCTGSDRPRSWMDVDWP